MRTRDVFFDSLSLKKLRVAWHSILFLFSRNLQVQESENASTMASVIRATGNGEQSTMLYFPTVIFIYIYIYREINKIFLR